MADLMTSLVLVTGFRLSLVEDGQPQEEIRGGGGLQLHDQEARSQEAPAHVEGF